MMRKACAAAPAQLFDCRLQGLRQQPLPAKEQVERAFEHVISGDNVASDGSSRLRQSRTALGEKSLTTLLNPTRMLRVLVLGGHACHQAARRSGRTRR